MKSTAPFAADEEDMAKIYSSAYAVYMRHKDYPDALLIAQKINDQDRINEVMAKCDDPIITKQLCLMLGR